MKLQSVARVLLLAALGLFQISWCCPDSCNCRSGGIVRCIGKSFTRVPTESIPLDVVQLALEENDITEIGPNDFRNFSKLEILSLGENRISSIDENAFADLVKLDTLRLNENSLKELPKDVFANNPLAVLSLRENKIVGLPDGIFSILTSLSSLDLRNNPLSCDCVTEWLSQWITNNTSIVTEPDNIVCDYPPSLKGTPIRSLTTDQFYCAAPNFTATPEKATVRTTSSLTISCSASGRPPPDFTWDKDNETVTSTSDGRITIQDGGSLLIDPVRLEDDGLYRCTASNREGTVTTLPVRVTVEESTCFDGALTSAHETDVDCGGPHCQACNHSQACTADRDCRGDLHCLGPHQLQSKLLYISKADSLYETCANETKAPSLIETRLKKAWIARGDPFPNLDASADLQAIVSELHNELAVQFEAPSKIFKNVKIATYERQIKAPLIQIEFELDHDNDPDTADDTRANLETLIHQGKLLGTLSLKDASYRVLVTL